MHRSRFPSGSAVLILLVLFVCLAGRSAVISVPDQVAASGQTIVASLSFSTEGARVSGIQFDIDWDAPLDVKVTFGSGLRASSKQLYASQLGPRVTRCLLIGTDGQSIPDGETIKLFVVVTGNDQTGSAQVRFSNSIATDPGGNTVSLPAAAFNVQIAPIVATAQQPNSNWNTPFVQVKLPTAVSGTQFGIRGAAIGPDSYAYLGSAAGVY